MRVMVILRGETITVITRGIDRVRVWREGRVGEGNLLVAAKLERVSVRLGRIRVGSQVEGLAGIEDGGALWLLCLLLIRVEVLIDINCVPPTLAAGAHGHNLDICAVWGIASKAPHSGKPVTLEIHCRFEVMPIHHTHAAPHAAPLYRLGRVVNWGHGVEGGVHVEACLESSLGGCRKVVKRRGLVVGAKGDEANQGRILDKLGDIPDSLRLGLLVEGPVGQERCLIGVSSRLERRRMLPLGRT